MFFMLCAVFIPALVQSQMLCGDGHAYCPEDTTCCQTDSGSWRCCEGGTSSRAMTATPGVEPHHFNESLLQFAGYCTNYDDCGYRPCCGVQCCPFVAGTCCGTRGCCRSSSRCCAGLSGAEWCCAWNERCATTVDGLCLSLAPSPSLPSLLSFASLAIITIGLVW